MTAASAHARPRRLPRIALLATGGTIAGAGPDSTAAAYVAGALRGQALLQAVPQLAQLAQVQVHELFALDSADISDAQRLQLAQRVAALARQGDVDGIVITHGTDTLEESAYLLHLTLKTAKPVVLTGAMRAATALGADGPLNLYQAVQVAASARAAGLGALVVMNGAIWSGRDVAKRDAAQVQALQSPYGPLGLVADDGPRFYRAPCRPHTLASEFDADALPALPAVAVAASYGGMSAAAWRALAAEGAQAIVHAGFGIGTVPQALQAQARRLRAQGVWLVRASRAGSGALPASARSPLWLCADDQTPAQARLLMALGLTRTQDAAALQALFERY